MRFNMLHSIAAFANNLGACSQKLSGVAVPFSLLIEQSQVRTGICFLYCHSPKCFSPAAWQYVQGHDFQDR